MERLSTDRSIAPLVAQFVPLKIETDGDQWGTWARKYSYEGSGIPIIYVVRADGEKMYGKSGSLGAQLAQFLTVQLRSAGKIFSAEQLAQVQTAVDEANKSLEAGDTLSAVKRLDSLKKLGPTGKLGSYAAACMAANQLVAQLTGEGQAALAAAKEQLAGNNKFAGTLAILSANRKYGALPELKRELGAAERSLRTHASRDVLEQAESLDKALALEFSKSGKKSVVEALARVVSRFPETPAAEIAQAKIAELGGNSETTATALPSDGPEYRTWTDVTGAFQVEAELLEATGAAVKLRLKKDGKTIEVPLKKLSDEDREYLKNL